MHAPAHEPADRAARSALLSRSKPRLKARKKRPRMRSHRRPNQSFGASCGCSSSAHSAGLSVSELNAESSVDDGDRERELAVELPGDAAEEGGRDEHGGETERDRDDGAGVTSSIALRVASRGDRPSAMWRSTFSTTTIASSTTMPIASTRPKSDSMFSEKPNAAITANVPISDTGIASSGITLARQVCRKTSTTSTTSTIASNSVWMTALIDSRTKIVGL